MMNKAVFLDRDGVINKERSYVTCLKEFEILPGLVPALKQMQEKGYLIIVITNQSGIAKGLYTHQTVNEIHQYLNVALMEQGVELTEIYYCPHHPTVSKCLCRKPDSIMIEKAIAKFQINPLISYFIGDKERDVLAANKAGIQNTILVEENESLQKIMYLIK